MTGWTNQGCHPWPEPDCPTCQTHDTDEETTQ